MLVLETSSTILYHLVWQLTFLNLRLNIKVDEKAPVLSLSFLSETSENTAWKSRVLITAGIQIPWWTNLNHNKACSRSSNESRHNINWHPEANFSANPAMFTFCFGIRFFSLGQNYKQNRTISFHVPFWAMWNSEWKKSISHSNFRSREHG